MRFFTFTFPPICGFDWKTLGLNPDKVKLTAPPINKFQEAAIFLPGDNISVEPTKGWLLIAEEQ